jgi:hypothetical protein
MDYIQRLDEDWEEIEATYKAVCEEPEEEERRSRTPGNPVAAVIGDAK